MHNAVNLPGGPGWVVNQYYNHNRLIVNFNRSVEVALVTFQIRHVDEVRIEIFDENGVTFERVSFKSE